MTEKKVLVLFYDKKDAELVVERKGVRRTLEEDVRSGFQKGVKYDIGIGSPFHQKEVVLAYMGEQKYDAIIPVAGLSCSQDALNMLMEQLMDNEKISIRSRRIRGELVSLYFGQQVSVPIIGVPTRDDFTDGAMAFLSMLMASSPSSAGCVALERGAQAARLVGHMLTNKWTDVKVVVPDMRIIQNESGEQPAIRSPGHEAGIRVVATLNEAFDVYGDAGISFGVVDFASYMRQTAGSPESSTLHVCIYHDMQQLRELSKLAPLVIAAYVPGSQRIHYAEFVEAVQDGLENVIHTRVKSTGERSGENAGVLAAQALYASNPNLKPARFTELKRQKSEANVSRLIEVTGGRYVEAENTGT